MKFEWKKDTRQYAAGERLYIGPWIIGGVYLDSTLPKGTKAVFRTSCLLPGAAGIGLYETMDAARLRAEQAAQAWFDKIPA